MDPFIEGQAWPDFHLEMIAALAHTLVPLVRPRYVVRAEQRVYLEHQVEPLDHIRPDIAILDDGTVPLKARGSAAGGLAAESVPVTLPMAQEEIEHFLTICGSEDLDVVTVIEVLSPANKRPGSDGRRE